MEEQTLLAETRDKMNKSVGITRDDLATIRTGRATPSLIENITVAVYGGSQKLKIMELATITAPDASTLTIAPFDISIIEEMAKGLQEARIGLTPVVDGETIRISVPTLSQEQRQEYLRFAKQKLEQGKVMIRQIRQDAMQQIKKATDDKEVSDDDKKRLEKRIQELTDEFNKQLDEMGDRKEKELLQI